MSTASARVLIEVQAGLLPGTPIPEYTSQWAITSEQWRTIKAGEPIQDVIDCDAYAMRLRLGGLNWVQTTWIYL